MFHDMELRVLNASPCPVSRQRPGGCFPYGTLYIYEEGAGQFLATFGDLTIPVSDSEANSLMGLARDRSIYQQR
jgi:hypothetical protein